MNGLQAKMFRKELAEKSARLEAVMAEKSQLQNRVKGPVLWHGLSANLKMMTVMIPSK